MPDAHHQQRYRVIEKLAAGGMAEVFRAESAGIEGFKKKVAIKRVLPHLSKKKKFISMFLDEARLSAHLSHSNVVQVFDIGMGDDTYFIVMEYVDGADLRAIMDALRKRRFEFPLEAAVYIATKICEGLDYAHMLADSDGRTFGVVHRDVSPPNVLITRFGEVKIADFGLAKANNQLEKSEPGVIKGKFSYLSPEAAMGQEVDLRADVFAVGIILWELLAGRKLFQGESDYETVKLVQQAVLPSLPALNPKVPPALERVIQRALARDLGDRYARAGELGRDLNAFLFHHGRPVGSWDIAELVRLTMEQKKRERPRGASIIGQLIEEALFEFTSLRSGDQDSLVSPGGSTPTGTPMPARVHDWESEILIKNPYETGGRAALPSFEKIELGNLSSLEDFPLSARRPAPSDPGQLSNELEPSPAPSSVGPGSSGKMKASGSGGAPAADEKRGSSKAILIIVALLVAAGAAGAWFANVVPH